MQDHPDYLFHSGRLAFRTWRPADLDALAAINADPRVMEFFPALQSREQTQAFMDRMEAHFAEQGFCYFAAEERASGELIGFIGLCTQDFPADFTPCTDIGWRLHPRFWGRGYAREGARAALRYVFEKTGIQEIFAIAPRINLSSIRVMEAIGMRKQRSFEHPLLAESPHLRTCVLYAINRDQAI